MIHSCRVCRQLRLLDSDSSSFELGAALVRMLPRSESEKT
jgi:hypothetical protein